MQGGEEVKVYVVSTGEYSDWSIECICSTREKAQLVVDQIKKESKVYGGYPEPNDIDEYELDFFPDGIKAGLNLYGVTGDLDFKTVGVSPEVVRYACDKVVVCGLPGKERFSVDVYARDEDHAKKIALEKFIQWKAEGGK